MPHFIIKFNKLSLRSLIADDYVVYGWDAGDGCFDMRNGNVVKFATEHEAQQWIDAHQVFAKDAQIVPVLLDLDAPSAPGA